MRGNRFVEAGGAGALLALSLLAFPHLAEARSYSYSSIAYDIEIRADSTFRVTERQAYGYNGEYHLGWRAIPHDRIDDITDVVVLDGTTGEPLAYSSARLAKEDPASWGKYTTWEEEGVTNVEWYYDLSGVAPERPGDNLYKEWVVAYTVHGGISFFEDADELYWNLFTDYEVPVYRVDVDVRLPGATSIGRAVWYTDNESYHRQVAERIDERTFRFSADLFPERTDATIALGFDKGLVDEAAYWRYLFLKNWPYLLSFLLLIGSIVFSTFHWYLTERHKKGRGVIIPQYEPPEALPPAMAEMLVRERLTAKAWPATVIDLSVRGYLKVEEDSYPAWRKAASLVWVAILLIGLALVAFIPFVILVRDLSDLGDNWPALILLVPLFFIAFQVTRGGKLKERVFPKHFLVKRSGKDLEDLQPYEKEFVELLCPSPDAAFSTKEMSQSPDKARANFMALQRIAQTTLSANTEDRTGAYERKLTSEYKGALAFGSVTILIVLPLMFLLKVSTQEPDVMSFVVLAIALVLSASVVWHRVAFDARLNEKGQILREDWLGFKLYLETAEKYRMQNLTPDIFERYLPYAMIFGVERQWARAFASLTMLPPSWYHGSSSAGTFSASAFAGGMSASFSSAFASAGTSASSGGGSAGGGGGGGGGGAS